MSRPQSRWAFSFRRATSPRLTDPRLVVQLTALPPKEPEDLSHDVEVR